MGKINKHIEIVSSSNKALSSMSEKSYKKIQSELSKYYKTVGLTLVETENDLQQLIDKKPDVVFLGMKKVPRVATTENSSAFTWVSDFLESVSIPHTGSESSASIIEEDKSRAKKIVRKAGLNTAGHFMAYSGQFTNKSQIPLKFPLFLKPPNLGGGQGIDDDSVVTNYKEYKQKINTLEEKFNSEALAEEYLTGREFTVAILKNNKNEGYYTMPLEMIAEPGKNGVQILGSKVKNADTERVVIVNDEKIKNEITVLALNVFELLGARDYGRVDIRMNTEGVAQFLEINLIPSLIENYGNFQKACEKVSKISYTDMLLMIVDLALNRSEIFQAQATDPQIELATV